MISVVSDGTSFKLELFLERMLKRDVFRILDGYAQEGVRALASATPIDSGKTASLWSYELQSGRGTYSIVWKNDNIVAGRQIAILLQYGHGTGTGGYVQGRDYINPALRPIFDRIAEAVWKEVVSA